MSGCRLKMPIEPARKFDGSGMTPADLADKIERVIQEAGYLPGPIRFSCFHGAVRADHVYGSDRIELLTFGSPVIPDA